MADKREETPNKFPLPPLMTVGVMVVCWLLDRYLPLGWEPEDVSSFMRVTGVLLIVCALAIDLWALSTFRKHNANMLPHKAASQLLMSGPFAHSRNPIYLGNIMLTAGLAFALGSRWFLFGAVVLYFLLSELAVKREERHLAAKFPQQWKQYSAIVRRWI